MLSATSIKWSPYIPHTPFTKQLAFLMLPHKEAFYGGAAGGGKTDTLLMGALQYALDIATLIPNPYGWIQIGDIKPGDELYSHNGLLTQVVGVTPIMQGKDCYELFFNDGTSIVADGDHKWAANNFTDRLATKRMVVQPQVVNTRYMFLTQNAPNHKRRDSNWSIPCHQPIHYPEQNLSVDPYVLGAWLGDGSKRDGTMVGIDDGTKVEFRKAGYSIKDYGVYQWHVGRLRTDLGMLDVLNNKHVPIQYLRGSIQQRLALLQGLMDTDGTVDKRYGGCRFFNTNPLLVKAVVELVRSFGWLAFVSTQRYVKQLTRKVGVGELVCFNANLPVFRLVRKVRLQKLYAKPHKIVVRIEKAKSRNVRCITVANKTGLFIAGEGYTTTHNCDIPGFSAIIFRRTLTEAKQSGAPLSRAHDWLQGMPGCKWKPSEHIYEFDTFDENGNRDIPSSIQFGYIGESNAYTRYQGIEIQFCAFDELGQYLEEDYTYLFSRLRKCVCPIHLLKDGPMEDGKPTKIPNYIDDCPKCIRSKSVPLRMRSAGNPGGIGMSWIKKRFGIIKNPDKNSKYPFIGTVRERPFLPSFYTDNVHLDHAYGKSLDELSDIYRKQLKFGDWSASAEARFKKDHFKYYSMRGASYALGPNGTGDVYNRNRLKIFGVIDPAMSIKAGPATDAIFRGKLPSYTVIGILGLTPDLNLMILDVSRNREEAPEVVEDVVRMRKLWRPDYFLFEENQGRSLWQFCQRKGIVIKPLWSKGDKVENSLEAQVRAKQGKIWLPDPSLGCSWLPDFEDEIFNWTGNPDATDDQVDMLSNAVRDVNWSNPESDYSFEDEEPASWHDSPGYVY